MVDIEYGRIYSLITIMIIDFRFCYTKLFHNISKIFLETVAEALYYYGNLLTYGTEDAGSACGLQFDSSLETVKRSIPPILKEMIDYPYNYNTDHTDEDVGDETYRNKCKTSMVHSKILSNRKLATLAYLRSAELGYILSLVPLAVTLLTGVGISPLIQWDVMYNCTNKDMRGIKTKDEPNRYKLRNRINKGNSAINLYSALSLAVCQSIRNLVVNKRSVLKSMVGDHRGVGNDFHGIRKMREKIRQGDFLLGASTLSSMMDLSGTGIEQKGVDGSVDDDYITQLALGLVHTASLFGVGEADAMLAYRYCETG